MKEITITARTPTSDQDKVIQSCSKRKVVFGDHRQGKTMLAVILAVDSLLEMKRVLYVNPFAEKLEKFWDEVCDVLNPLIKTGHLKRNDAGHTIGWEDEPAKRIKAKTGHNASCLKGCWADLVILDDAQSMDDDTWNHGVTPALLDTNGDAVIMINQSNDWEIFQLTSTNPFNN